MTKTEASLSVATDLTSADRDRTGEQLCIVQVIGLCRIPEDAFRVVKEAGLAAGDQRLFLFDFRRSLLAGNTTQIYDFGAAVIEHGLDRTWRVAFVYQSISSLERFLEAVMANRGLNTRAFDDFGKALQWLGTGSQARRTTICVQLEQPPRGLVNRSDGSSTAWGSFHAG